MSNEPREKITDTEIKNVSQRVECKYCQGHNLIKWGKQNGHQRFKCKDCNHIFDDNGLPPRMRTKLEIIANALELYYGGASLPTTSRLLRKFFKIKASPRTILNWIQRYVPLIEDFTKYLLPQTSKVWHADETAISIRPRKSLTKEQKRKKKRRKGEQHWFWDAIDEKTRYILGCHMSRNRSQGEATKFFIKCRRNAGKPKRIYTDGMRAYNRGISKGLRIHTRNHIANIGLHGGHNNQLIERFHATLKGRLVGTRGLVSPETCIPRGFVIYYNYLRPHTSLDGRTPAEASEINLLFEDGWGDLIRWSTTFEARKRWDDGVEGLEIELVAT